MDRVAKVLTWLRSTQRARHSAGSKEDAKSEVCRRIFAARKWKKSTACQTLPFG